ncbi:hypothetical protein [Bacillus sp. SM2101]|uniref:hypothetical protein n=1 Tax=Bacillus sp. SM2101 TaxID=2805366 RepID=UPI001BDDD8E8|nr:hypothetical protein [Bacillus sp. SM2101]
MKKQYIIAFPIIILAFVYVFANGYYQIPDLFGGYKFDTIKKEGEYEIRKYRILGIGTKETLNIEINDQNVRAFYRGINLNNQLKFLNSAIFIMLLFFMLSKKLNKTPFKKSFIILFIVGIITFLIIYSIVNIEINTIINELK